MKTQQRHDSSKVSALRSRTFGLARETQRILTGPILLLALWELASRQNWVYRPFVPPPTELVSIVVEVASDITSDILDTSIRAFIGFAIGTGLGLMAAILTSQSMPIRRTIGPVIEFLRPLPSTAIIPLAVIQLGYGARMYAFAIAYSVAWPVYIAAYEALNSTSPNLIRVGRSVGMSRLTVLVRVKLRSAGPAIAAGMRVGLAFAIIVAIVSEMLFGQSGLGFQMTRYAFGGRMPEFFAVACYASLMGVSANYAFVRLNRLVHGWYYGFSAKN